MKPGKAIVVGAGPNGADGPLNSGEQGLLSVILAWLLQ